MVIAAPPTSFIGRVSEIELVGQLLEETRLLTIMGTAGSGKTRLAYAAAHRFAARYPGGVFTCELAPLANGERLAAKVAAAFDVGTDPGDRVVEFVAQQIGDKGALLVLDNCEHVRSAVAELVIQLLAGTRALSILATSRERLHVAGETAWPIPAMSLPRDPGGIEGSDAAQLLLERVRALNPGYTMSADAAAAVVQICTRLEGLPLAIELAAGRLLLVPPAQLVKMLDDAVVLLAGGEGLPRHRTIRAALDWSYELLTEEDRATFRRLSVFAGSFKLSAASAALEMDENGALDRLAALRDRSLLVADTGGATASFRLLEPLRQYADDRLHMAGDEEIARRLHARWALFSIESVCAGIFGHAQLAAVRAFRELLPDFRRAFNWSLVAEPAWAARMAAATVMAWEVVGQLAEGDAILRAALEAHPTKAELARIYYGLANLALHRNDPQTLVFAQLAVGSARDGACTGIELGHALCVLGFASVVAGKPELSLPAFDEAAEVADRIGDRLLRVWVDSGRTHGLALAGRLEDARKAWEAQIPVLVELGDVHHVSRRFSNLAYLCVLQGDNVGARRALRSNLPLLAQYRNWAVNTNNVGVAAVLAARAGRAREAARLAGAYRRLCVLFDLKLGTMPDLDLAQTHLARADYEAAMVEGEALPIAEMYDLARQEAERSDPADYGQLSGRELQVTKLVARGLSNREVAARLGRSERTVESHVQHALGKLNMTSRTELGAWAQKHGLLD